MAVKQSKGPHQGAQVEGVLCLAREKEGGKKSQNGVLLKIYIYKKQARLTWGDSMMVSIWSWVSTRRLVNSNLDTILTAEEIKEGDEGQFGGINKQRLNEHLCLSCQAAADSSRAILSLQGMSASCGYHWQLIRSTSKRRRSDTQNRRVIERKDKFKKMKRTLLF